MLLGLSLIIWLMSRAVAVESRKKFPVTPEGIQGLIDSLDRFPWCSLYATVIVALTMICTIGSLALLQVERWSTEQVPTLQTTMPPIPLPTPTLAPSSIGLTISSVDSKAEADGTVKKTADLSIASLVIGGLQWTYPQAVKLGDSIAIRLSISPSPALTNLPKVAAAPSFTITAGASDYFLAVNNSMKLRPRMTADLQAVNFYVAPDDRPEKPIVSSIPAEWTWNATPKQAGSQTLILQVSIPVYLDNSSDVITLAKSIPIDVPVEDAPALPIFQQLVKNFPVIAVALIALFGVLVGAILKYKSDMESK